MEIFKKLYLKCLILTTTNIVINHFKVFNEVRENKTIYFAIFHVLKSSQKTAKASFIFFELLFY